MQTAFLHDVQAFETSLHETIHSGEMGGVLS